MAFLTESSYNQLIQRVEIKSVEKIDKQYFVTNIFENERLFYFFNQLELKKILTEKLLLSGEGKGLIAYKEVPDRQDNLNYVLSIKGKIKYHKNNECKALQKGFRNFSMPEVVVQLEQVDGLKHVSLVQDIRNWFKEKEYTIEKYEQGEINDLALTRDFNNTFPQKYGIDKITISQSDKAQFKWFTEKKTNAIIQTEKSFNYNDFLKNISKLTATRDVICTSPTMRNLSKLDYLVNKDDQYIVDFIHKSISDGYLKNVDISFITNYKLERLKKFWITHKEMKNEAKNLLSEFFKWTYNYNSSTFDEIFLEDYNLKACSLCYK